jgi:nicotinate-nucleotide adenylyltransferase
MARAALEHLKLDEIVFIPTGTTRYRNAALASGEHRVAMLQLALQGNPRYRMDQRELQPGASGYTVDTLKALGAERTDAEFYLLIGADQYEKLASWHRPEEIKRLAKIAVFGRPGIELKDEDELERIPMAAMPVSASEIRERAKRGEDLSRLVPPAVANYIARHRLYS